MAESGESPLTIIDSSGGSKVAAASLSSNVKFTQGEELALHQRILKQQQELIRTERDVKFVKNRRQQLEALEAKMGMLRREKPPVLMTNDEKRRASVKLGWTPKVPCELVPIRLDIDMDGYKLRDTFTWNLQEEALSMEEFAELTCKDFDLPLATFSPAIIKSIREQLQEYKEAGIMLRNAGGLPALNGIRALVKFDITIGLVQLIDQIEWDLGEIRNNPFKFASDYVKELALPMEFITAISNDILEQVYHIRRALLLVGYSKDSSGLVKVNDVELQKLILPPIRIGATRRDPNTLNDFTPIITELEASEVERIESSRDREARRKRRQTRGRRAPSEGVSMANWTLISPPKTIRTPLSYRGSLHRILNRGDDDDPNDSTTPTRTFTRTRKSRK